MEKIFEREYYLRTSDFDKNRQILPSSVLDLFQDAAGAHAKTLNCGYDALVSQSLVWVLTRVRYTRIADAPMFSKIKVKTWPLPPTRFGYTREYKIMDENGNMLFKGSSEWVLMDVNERRLAAGKNVYNLTEFCEERIFEDRALKLKSFETGSAPVTVYPRFTDIDMNGHVNNTKYLNFVLDSAKLKEDEKISALQIDYRKEVLADTALHIFSLKENGSLFSRGEDKDGNVMFLAKLDIM